MRGAPHRFARGFVLKTWSGLGHGNPRVVLTEEPTATCETAGLAGGRHATFEVAPGPKRSFFVGEPEPFYTSLETHPELGTGEGSITFAPFGFGDRTVRASIRFVDPYGRGWSGGGDVDLAVCGDPWSLAYDVPAPTGAPMQVTRGGGAIRPKTALAVVRDEDGTLTWIVFLDAPRGCGNLLPLLKHEELAEVATITVSRWTLGKTMRAGGAVWPSAPPHAPSADPAATGWLRIDAAHLEAGGEVRGEAAAVDQPGSFVGTFVATVCRG
jgi:hypothetical protein